MPGFFSTLTLNQKLAAAAAALGAIAIFANPLPGGAVSIDARTLADIVERDADRIEPVELADWIIQGRSDFRLIDVRDAEAYAKYHVPGAEHVPFGSLTDAALPRNEKLVVYADDGVRAAQAWFLLRARGHAGAYLLRDGLDGWQQEVLFPALGDATTPFQQQRNARLSNVASHFGGRPRSGDAGAAPAVAAMALPTPPAPVAGAGVPAGGAKKKKEGC